MYLSKVTQRMKSGKRADRLRVSSWQRRAPFTLRKLNLLLESCEDHPARIPTFPYGDVQVFSDRPVPRSCALDFTSFFLPKQFDWQCPHEREPGHSCLGVGLLRSRNNWVLTDGSPTGPRDDHMPQTAPERSRWQIHPMGGTTSYGRSSSSGSPSALSSDSTRSPRATSLTPKSPPITAMSKQEMRGLSIQGGERRQLGPGLRNVG